MAQVAAIVHVKKNANLTPKDGVSFQDFLAKLLEEHQTGVGICVVRNGLIQAIRKEIPLPLDKIMNLINKTNDGDRFIYLVDSDKKLGEKDIQPFIALTDEKNEPLVAVLCEGDFDGYEDESGNTSAGNLFDTYISDKLAKLLETSDNDLDQMFKKLKDRNGSTLGSEFLEAALTKDIRQQGTIAICSVDGDIVTFVRNQEHKHYDWGWASRDPEAAEEAEEELDTTEDADDLESLLDEENSKPEKPAVVPGDKLQVRPGAEIKGRQRLRQWYVKHNGGAVPPKFTNRPYIMVDRATWEKQTGQKAGPPPSDPRASSSPAAIAAAQGTPASNSDKPNLSAPIGQLDGAVKDAMSKYLASESVKKHLDVNSETVLDPATIDGLLNKATPFHEQMGLKSIYSISQLPNVVLMQIGKTSLASLVNIASSFRQEMLKLNLALTKANEKISSIEARLMKPEGKPDPKPQDAPATPEAIVQRRAVIRARR